MPYVTPEARISLDSIPVGELGKCALTPGDLNYVISKIINDNLETWGYNYERLNAIHGALHACADEFYRRVVVPYEDKKIASNGDVYTCLK